MRILSNTLDCSHGEKLSLLCKDAEEVVLASPFCYPDFSGFADVIKNAGSISKVIFITTAKKNEIAGKIDSLLSFSGEMERIGVQWQLRVDNRLHGKIYIFKKGGAPFAGIITSANLTHNGMVANHEWGVQLDDEQLLQNIESQIITDAPSVLTRELLDEIKERVNTAYPSGVQMQEPFDVDIDDILHTYQVPKDTRIFIKPIGVSDRPVYEGDFSDETDLYFSKKRPASVRFGDILITYAVGGRKIIGAYRVTSVPKWDEDGDPRWPWYVESECMTPSLSNHRWERVCPYVTQIANDYAEKYGKPVTHNGNDNLGALNFGWDKIWLDDEYGGYLLSKLMDLERIQENGKQERRKLACEL